MVKYPGERPDALAPSDGTGWYIVEGEPGNQTVRCETRYNIKCAATSDARFRWPNETLTARFWDAARCEWSD